MVIQTTYKISSYSIGRRSDAAPEPVDKLLFNRRKRRARVQELIRQTWESRMQEYLTGPGSMST